MLCIASQRKSAFLGSKLSWKDILEIAIRGTGDGIYGHPNNNPIQIASHEAGHAVLTIIESNGKNIPDYVSILPGKDMLGVMAEDYEQSYASLGYMSFAMIRSKIRIMLAGRAGEEVLLGETGVGISTANEDLREATWQAFALMARGGVHAHYGKNYSPQERLGLLVTIRNKVPENSDYFQEQARLFLSEQYAEVKQMLLKNRELLSVLQHELVANKILLQDDVTRILASTNQPHFPLAA
jgi:ATP-dependent Zn protease